jgi:hypothetical protein
MNRRPAGRLARLRYRLGWRLLGEPGREHFVCHVVDQIAEHEARAAKDRIRLELANDPAVRDGLADLLASDPEAGRAACRRLGIEVIDPPTDEAITAPAGLPATDSEPTATGGIR